PRRAPAARGGGTGPRPRPGPARRPAHSRSREHPGPLERSRPVRVPAARRAGPADPADPGADRRGGGRVRGAGAHDVGLPDQPVPARVRLRGLRSRLQLLPRARRVRRADGVPAELDSPGRPAGPGALGGRAGRGTVPERGERGHGGRRGGPAVRSGRPAPPGRGVPPGGSAERRPGRDGRDRGVAGPTGAGGIPVSRLRHLAGRFVGWAFESAATPPPGVLPGSQDADPGSLDGRPIVLVLLLGADAGAVTATAQDLSRAAAGGGPRPLLVLDEPHFAAARRAGIATDHVLSRAAWAARHPGLPWE